MSAIPDASVLELLPDEQNRFILICTSVSRKYIGKSNTLDNMAAYQNEVIGRCRDELNLEVDFDAANMELDYNTGEWYSSPTVTPIRKLVPEAFDFAKARYETQQGFADGVPGVIKEDGSFVEPVKPIALAGGISVDND